MLRTGTAQQKQGRCFDWLLTPVYACPRYTYSRRGYRRGHDCGFFRMVLNLALWTKVKSPVAERIELPVRFRTLYDLLRTWPKDSTFHVNAHSRRFHCYRVRQPMIISASNAAFLPFCVYEFQDTQYQLQKHHENRVPVMIEFESRPSTLPALHKTKSHSNLILQELESNTH